VNNWYLRPTDLYLVTTDLYLVTTDLHLETTDLYKFFCVEPDWNLLSIQNPEIKRNYIMVNCIFVIELASSIQPNVLCLILWMRNYIQLNHIIHTGYLSIKSFQLLKMSLLAYSKKLQRDYIYWDLSILSDWSIKCRLLIPHTTKPPNITI